MTDVAENVKRPYRSERRRDQAEQTRLRILGAARDQFVANGFDATSIGSIAETAGVSPETVYARFRTKRALLGEVAQRAVRGEDAAPVTGQRGFAAVVEERDQREQLRMFAADIVPRLERAAPVVAVVAAAAPAHPDLAELLERLHADRFANLRRLVDALAANGPLALPRERAAETVWALSAPELHQALVRQRGWSRRRYSTWLAESLAALLLP